MVKMKKMMSEYSGEPGASTMVPAPRTPQVAPPSPWPAVARRAHTCSMRFSGGVWLKWRAAMARTRLIPRKPAAQAMRKPRGSVLRSTHIARRANGSATAKERMYAPTCWSSILPRTDPGRAVEGGAAATPWGMAATGVRLVAADARVRRHVLAQELHLVGEDAAVGEDQELGAVRDVGRVQELHVRFLGRAVALLLVAVAAGGHDVHPGVPAAARHRHDVVAGELVGREVAAAEGAHELVAVEELAVVERRDLVESLDGERFAADGDDRVGGDARTLAGAVATTAPEGELLSPQLPRHAFLGVIPDRLLPGDPTMGYPVLVEGEDEWQASSHVSIFASQIADLDHTAGPIYQFFARGHKP